LKYFFYVNVGLVALALFDLLFVIDLALKSALTPHVTFLAVTQYVVFSHQLLFEKFMFDKPFMKTEKLGFFWLFKTMLCLPFLWSMPVHYAAVTEIGLSKPALLADSVLFLFGFVVYAHSIHLKENFVRDPRAYDNLKSVKVGRGKRMLADGTWGIVQKPDYLGYMLIWLSWTIACDFSAISLIVLAIVYTTVWSWLGKIENEKKARMNTDWDRVKRIVPNRLIPYVF